MAPASGLELASRRPVAQSLLLSPVWKTWTARLILRCSALRLLPHPWGVQGAGAGGLHSEAPGACCPAGAGEEGAGWEGPNGAETQQG